MLARQESIRLGSIAGARRACRPLASFGSRGEGRPTYLKGLERSTTGLSVSNTRDHGTHPSMGVSQRAGARTRAGAAAAVTPGPWLDSDGLPRRHGPEHDGPGGGAGSAGGAGGGVGGGGGGGGGPSHEQLHQVGERRREQQTHPNLNPSPNSNPNPYPNPYPNPNTNPSPNPNQAGAADHPSEAAPRAATAPAA